MDHHGLLLLRCEGSLADIALVLLWTLFALAACAPLFYALGWLYARHRPMGLILVGSLMVCGARWALSAASVSDDLVRTSSRPEAVSWPMPAADGHGSRS